MTPPLPFFLFRLHLFQQSFRFQEFIHLQAPGATKIQCAAVNRFCDGMFRLQAAMFAFHHSITGPIINDGTIFATARPRRMV